MAFGLVLGKVCSVGGSWISVRSRGSYTHTAWGRRRHIGLKASHSRVWQKPGQPCRSEPSLGLTSAMAVQFGRGTHEV